MKQKTIEARNLTIGYSTKKNTRMVAENINSTIYSGELTCLLGANGVGKSTLLKTLSGFTPQLSGSIYIQGKDLQLYKARELSKCISVVLTEKIDIKNMTARELIGLGRSPYNGFWGKLNNIDNEIIDKSIELVKIQKLIHRMVHTLSDGERQKVMITKALVQDTPIILLDEPTAFLDFPSKVEIMQLLHQLSRKTNKTIFLSTHDLELALQIADKVWLMGQQKGLEIGTPEDLSLNGSLSHFFARKGILFDKESGLFRIKNELYKQIKLVGDGSTYTMIQKALSRNGINASKEICSNSYIEVIEGQIIYCKHATEPIFVDSIEDLLDKITLV